MAQPKTRSPRGSGGLLEASGRGAVTGVHGVCSLQAHGGCADRLSILSPLPLRPRVCVWQMAGLPATSLG